MGEKRRPRLIHGAVSPTSPLQRLMHPAFMFRNVRLDGAGMACPVTLSRMKPRSDAPITLFIQLPLDQKSPGSSPRGVIRNGISVIRYTFGGVDSSVQGLGVIVGKPCVWFRRRVQAVRGNIVSRIPVLSPPTFAEEVTNVATIFPQVSTRYL